MMKYLELSAKNVNPSPHGCYAFGAVFFRERQIDPARYAKVFLEYYRKAADLGWPGACNDLVRTF